VGLVLLYSQEVTAHLIQLCDSCVEHCLEKSWQSWTHKRAT